MSLRSCRQLLIGVPDGAEVRARSAARRDAARSAAPKPTRAWGVADSRRCGWCRPLRGLAEPASLGAEVGGSAKPAGGGDGTVLAGGKRAEMARPAAEARAEVPAQLAVEAPARLGGAVPGRRGRSVGRIRQVRSVGCVDDIGLSRGKGVAAPVVWRRAALDVPGRFRLGELRRGRSRVPDPASVSD